MLQPTISTISWGSGSLGCLSKLAGFYSNCGLLASGGYLLLPGLYDSGPFIPIEVHELSSVTTCPSPPGLQRRATTEHLHSILMPLVNGVSSGPSHEQNPLVVLFWPYVYSHCSIPTFSLFPLPASSRVRSSTFSTLLSVDYHFFQASKSHRSKQLSFFHPLGCSVGY